MSLFTDIEYIQRLAPYLDNFKAKGSLLWNFRCPFCGDSNKKRSAHGYVFPAKTDDTLMFHCHKCISTSLGNLIKQISVDLYKEYIRDRFAATVSLKKRDWKEVLRDLPVERRERSTITNPLAGLPTIKSLADDHPAKLYIRSRQIPKQFESVLLYAEDFAAVIDRWFPRQYALKSEARIVIPFRDGKGQLLAIQGRDLSPKSSLRYITIKDKSAAPKIFGLDRIDQKIERIYVVEGPIDSMFLPNALACAGSDLPKILPKNRCVIVYDNEPYSHEICQKIEKAIQYGYMVSLFPERVKEKDINDMILSGRDISWVIDTIEENICSGIGAKIKFAAWRKDERKRTVRNHVKQR